MLELGIIKEIAEINTVINALKHLLTLKHADEKDTQDFKAEAYDSKPEFTLESMTIAKATQFYEKAKAAGPGHVDFSFDDLDELEAPPMVIECKKKICDILLFGLGIMNEHRVEDFLVEFKEILENLKAEDLGLLIKLSLKDEQK